MASRLLPSLSSVLRTPVCRGSIRLAVPQSRNYGKSKESKPWKQKPNRKARLPIILTKDIGRLGTKGQLVRVKHGYARNWLLPQKVAVYATPDNIKLHDAWEAEEGVDTETDYAEYLRNTVKVLTVERDPSLAEFPVIEQEVSTAFRKWFMLHVPLDCIEIQKPIMGLGEHSVGIRVDESTLVSVPVRVVEWTPRTREKKGIEQNLGS